MLRYFLSGFQMGYDMGLGGCWPAANCYGVFLWYNIIYVPMYPLVWAEPKTIANSAILYVIKFVLYHFTVEPPCFYGINRKPLKRAF
jgi:hypothetical protein